MEKEYVLDFYEIDETEEIDGDEQLALVWCETCGARAH
jgi:hypothetical protein